MSETIHRLPTAGVRFTTGFWLFLTVSGSFLAQNTTKSAEIEVKSVKNSQNPVVTRTPAVGMQSISETRVKFCDFFKTLSFRASFPPEA